MKANGGGVEGRSVGSPAPKPAPVAEEAEEPASVEPASVERIGFYQQLEPAPARLDPRTPRPR